MDKEIEYKWQAQASRDYRAFLHFAQEKGVKVSKPRKVVNKDCYLDIPERFFISLKLECRIRLTDEKSELTLKSLSEHKQEVFIRDEKTIDLPHFTSKNAVLKYCREHFFSHIQPLFEILNNRQIQIFTLPCGTIAEASFDQVLMSCGEKKFRMKEIELEFKSGQLEEFNEFVSQMSVISLTPSKLSKFEVGMQQFSENDFPRLAESLQETANGIMGINIAKLKKNRDLFISSTEAGSCGKSIIAEAVHDMRVATRRLRAAIKIFKKILPNKAKKVRNELSGLGDVLGDKRDLDVFYDFVTNSVKSRTFEPLRIGKIDRSQKILLNILKSKANARLLKSVESLEAAQSKQNVLKISRNLIKEKLSIVLEMASEINLKTDDETLHRLRIALKMLRYTCEFFEPLFSKYICSLDPFIKKTIRVQDILGAHQDAIKGLEILKRYKKKFTAEDFIHIQKKYELQKRRSHGLFFKIWKNFWFGEGFNKSKPETAPELIF